MPSYRSISIFCILILGIASIAYTQPFQPHFQHFTVNDGLPSSEVYYILQDREDYIWFGTDEGVARFDGNKFEVFGSDKGLESSVIFKILEDEKGVIWVSTYQGTVFYFENGRFHPYIYNDVLKKIKKKLELIKLVDTDYSRGFLFEVKKQGMFYLTADGQVNWLTAAINDKTFLYQQTGKQNLNQVKASVSFQKNSKSKFYALERYNHQYQKWRRFTRKKLRGYINDHILFPEHDQLLIAANRHLSVFNTKDSSLPPIQVLTKPKACNYALRHQKKGFLLCRANGGGLEYWHFDENRTTLVHATTLFQGYSISFGLYDRQGGLWIASSDSGVFYAPFPNTPIFVSKKVGYPIHPLSVALVGDSCFYAGYSNGDIHYHNYKNGSNGLIDPTGDYLSSKIFSLYYDKENERLYNNRYIYSPKAQDKGKTSTTVAYKNKKGKYIKTTIREIHQLNPQNKDQLLFILTNGFGYIDLKNQTMHWNYSKSNNSTNKPSTFNAYYIDHLGQHWIGSLHGLLRFNPSQKSFEEEDFSFPPLNNRIVRITQLPDQSYLFGTRGAGLIYHNSDTTYAVDKLRGLVSNNVRDVQVTEEGVVWVASKDGLSKLWFNQDACIGELRTFHKAHGLPHEEIFDIATRYDQVWLSTNAGIIPFREPAIEKFSKPPTITHISANGETISTKESQSLSSKQNSLDILFHTIDYRLTSEIKYRYRLLKSRPWQETGQGVVEYPSLLPGHYQFEVQSQNRDGVWSESTVLPIYVAPPWHGLLWVRLLAGIIILSSIGGFIYQRDRRLRKEQAYLQQIDHLERAALQAQMNPHFVFNSLNSIQHFILNNEVKQAAQYLAKFARLIRDTLRVSAHGQHSLSDEIHMLENYISLEKLRFKNGFSYNLNVSDQLVPDRIQIPTLLIQPFVENAIKHGLKSRENDGHVDINFMGNAQELKVTITDNGTGFKPNKVIKTDSMGMNITRRRLELMSKTKQSCQMDVNLLKDENDQIAGTEIIIFIQPTSSKN